MKKMTAYVLAGVLTLGCAATAFGAEKIAGTVTVRDTAVTQPLYGDALGTKLVPVREVSDLLGYTVAWDKTTRSVTVSDGSTTVGFAAGKDAYTVGGSTKTLGAAPELIDGVQYVPVEVFSAFFPVAIQTKAGQTTLTDLKGADVEQISGTVVEAAQYNLVLRLADGTLRLFAKDQTDMTLAGSLEKDSPVTVYYNTADHKTALKLVQGPAETEKPAETAPAESQPDDGAETETDSGNTPD